MAGKRGRSAITGANRQAVHGEESPEDHDQREHWQAEQEEVGRLPSTISSCRWCAAGSRGTQVDHDSNRRARWLTSSSSSRMR